MNSSADTSQNSRSLIRFRILLLTISTNIISICCVGALAYYVFFESLFQKELELLGMENVKAAQRLQSSFQGLEKDVRYLAGTPPIRGILKARQNDGFDSEGSSSLEQWKNRLNVLFSQMMRANPTYLQIRLITADDGKELVRVNHLKNGDIEVLKDEEMQVKKKEPYFFEALNRAEDEIYFSDYDLNRENNKVEKPYKPVIRAALPIFDENKKAFAIIVINDSAASSLVKLRDYHTTRSVYVIDHYGRYLLHPDHNKGFQFDTKSTGEAHKEMPELFNEIQKASKSSLFQKVLTLTNQQHNETEQALNFTLVKLDSKDLSRYIAIVHESSVEPIFEKMTSLRMKVLYSAICILFFAIIISVRFSKTITEPINQLKNAIQKFPVDKDLAGLPVNVKGEIGTLARTFRKMGFDVEIEIRERESIQEQLLVKNQELQKSNEDLEYLPIPRKSATS
jgi:hypothetical protein